MKVKIDKIWDHAGRCRYGETVDGQRETWIVANLWEQAKDLPVQEMPMSALNLWSLHPKVKTMRDFVAHMKNVLEADMSYPIILDEDGWVMDGRHRIAKALLEGHEKIKFVRFDITPSPDLTVDA